ncbi:MAG: ComEC/Rec2 family competence protein, partial [Gammaproteobacteria bacterium]
MRAAPHQHSFVSNPLAQLAAAFAGGILVTQVFSFPLLPVLLVAALLSFATFAALLKNQLDLATVTVTIALLLLGVSFAAVEKHSVSSTSLKHLIDAGVILVGDPVELTGVVDRAPEFAPRGVYLTLRVEGISAKGGVRNASGVVALLIPSSAGADGFKELELRYGARLLVMTTLNRSDSFRNPGVSTFTEYLDRKGYDATGLVRSPLLIERLDDERVFLPLAWLYEWRRKIQEQIESKFSPQTAGVLNAALLGNRYGLSRETAERFRDGGTFHVLVISGLHISFIGGLVFLVARRITKRRSMQFAMSAALLWSYTFAVGAEVSVVRAAFMFTFVAFAPIVSRRAASLNALGAAASLLLVLCPRD